MPKGLSQMGHDCVVIGAGAWGTALALHLARSGRSIGLWTQDEAHTKEMRATRKNTTYLGDFSFPDNLHIVESLSAVLQHSKSPIILIAVPSVGFLSTLQRIAAYGAPPLGIISASKGLSDGGDLLPVLIESVFPGIPFGILSGPSFASEVAKNLPTAVTFASTDLSLGIEVVNLFHHGVFRIYQSKDIVGVSLGGCVKNVLAIAVGIADGLGLGANARAALITRGIAELLRLGAVLKADPRTLMGLAGLGDLVLTCTDDQSRNRRFGLCLGQGKSISEALVLVKRAVEGYKNATQLHLMAHKHHVDMPIVESVYQVLYQAKSPHQVLIDLMSRTSNWES